MFCVMLLQCYDFTKCMELFQEVHCLHLCLRVTVNQQVLAENVARWYYIKPAPLK